MSRDAHEGSHTPTAAGLTSIMMLYDNAAPKVCASLSVYALWVVELPTNLSKSPDPGERYSGVALVLLNGDTRKDCRTHSFGKPRL